MYICCLYLSDLETMASEDQQLLVETKESIKTVKLMPEYLVVCCWRSIKEVSLTLGQLTKMAPLIDPHGDQQAGLVSLKQVYSKSQIVW